MTTHVRIIVEEKKDVLVIPNNAIRFEEGKTVVYLKGKNKTEAKQVTLGIRDDKLTEVIKGLGEGEIIVIPAVVRKLLRMLLGFEEVISLRNIKKSYFIGERELPILKGIDLEIKNGNSLSSWVFQGPGRRH